MLTTALVGAPFVAFVLRCSRKIDV